MTLTGLRVSADFYHQLELDGKFSKTRFQRRILRILKRLIIRLRCTPQILWILLCPFEIPTP